MSNSASSNIMYDSERLQEIVQRWSENAKGKFRDFENYLVLSELELPIQLSNWNEENCTFEVITNFGNKINVSLDFEGQNFNYRKTRKTT